MELNRKDIIIVVLSFSLLLSSMVNILFSVQLGYPHSISIEKEMLIVGTRAGPWDLDSTDAWDSASNDVIRQVCETLFFNNLSDPDLPRVNWLCESYSWDDDVTLRINIRTGVKFHDGTTMDAAACAWNFDRLIYLMNHTREMPGGAHRSKIHSLYEFSDGSPVINSTTIVDSDTFLIHLNGHYSQLLAAMAYVACSILSPSSTPFDRFLDTWGDDLIGTGPYQYDYYIFDKEVKFSRWEKYWGSPANSGLAYFDVMIYNVIDDSTSRNWAMVLGDIDYISGTVADFFNIYNESPFLTFHENDNPGLGIYYLTMNNDITLADGDPDWGINITWRKAISYAINYTYIIQEMWDNQMVRAYSFISPGFGPYYDPDLQKIAPYCNYTIARQAIIDDLGPVNSVVAGLPNTQPGYITDQKVDDDAWEAVTLISINYSYHINNWFRAALYDMLFEWLGKIGIHLVDKGTWGGPWLLYPPPCPVYPLSPGCFDYLHLSWLGWGPDYFDPMNMIQLLVSNISLSNSAQVNDLWLETQIMSYNSDITLTESEKIEIIHNISHYLATEAYTHVFGFHTKIFTVHAADLYNVPYNVLGNFWAYPIKRNLTWHI